MSTPIRTNVGRCTCPQAYRVCPCMQRQNSEAEKQRLLEEANVALGTATGMPGVLEDALPEQAASVNVKLPSRRERAEALCTAALIQHSLAKVPDAGKSVRIQATHTAPLCLQVQTAFMYTLLHLILRCKGFKRTSTIANASCCWAYIHMCDKAYSASALGVQLTPQRRAMCILVPF
jgi:hypothetical protein